MQQILAVGRARMAGSMLQALSVSRFTIIVHLIVAGLVSVASGQSRNTLHTLKLDDPASQPAATIDSVAWMVGAWKGEAFGGIVEEVWTAASGGTIVGMFKLMHDNQPSMYEFELIVEYKGSLMIQLKHFNADFSGWEQKDKFVSFPLVKLTADAAYFDGLTYLRDGPDRLRVYVALKKGDEFYEEEIIFHRL